METSGKVVVAKYFSAQCQCPTSLSTFSRTSTKIIFAGFPNYLLLVAPVNWVVEVCQSSNNNDQVGHHLYSGMETSAFKKVPH